MTKRTKKILIHDFSGHPFQLELSKELTKNSYTVFHVYFDNGQGPKGDFFNSKNSQLNITPIKSVFNYSKSNLIKRFLGDFIYGLLLLIKILSIKPDIVVSGNSPIDSFWGISLPRVFRNFKYIYWAHDFYGPAISHIFSQKLGLLGKVIGNFYFFREKMHIQKSDGVIAISESFKKELQERYQFEKPITVIPNWGNFEDVLYKSPDYNNEKFKVIYTGTLGWKHNPKLITWLCGEFKNSIDFEIYAQGVGVDHLKKANENKRLNNLIIHDLLEYKDFINKLSEANLLLCILENEAGSYSVPSKVMNYLCAGRPILFFGPKSNLAANIISRNEAGLVFEHSQKHLASKKINELLNNKSKVLKMGENARNYANSNFQISRIVSVFIRALENEK